MVSVHANTDQGHISTLNSTFTPLSDGATFTGTGEDVAQFATITVFMDSDINGSLSMQFSADGTNWDRAKVVPLDILIGGGSVHTLEVVSQFFRVVYTNSTGNGAQTHLRLQTLFHKNRSGFLTSSPDQMISKINDAQIVRVSNDASLDVSRGLYADKFTVRKFGHHGSVPSGSFEDIWAYGGVDATINWATTDEKFYVLAGGNSNDTSAGTGCRSIQVEYLDLNGDTQQEQLILAGASASNQTAFTGRRVNRAWCDTAGTIMGNNTGRIIIANVTTGLVIATIEAGIGQTENPFYTVPNDCTCYLLGVEADIATGTNKDADVKFWQRQSAYTITAPFGVKRLIREWDAIQGYNPTVYKAFPSYPEFTDLWFTGQGNGATTEIDIDFDLLCVKDEASTIPQ